MKRYVSTANTTAIENEGRGRRRQTSPTLSSGESSDTFTLTQEDGQEPPCEPTQRVTRTKRVTKRRTQLSDGEDRVMANDVTTPQ